METGCTTDGLEFADISGSRRPNERALPRPVNTWSRPIPVRRRKPPHAMKPAVLRAGRVLMASAGAVPLGLALALGGYPRAYGTLQHRHRHRALIEHDHVELPDVESLAQGRLRAVA